jgi:hypothetical protein
MRDRVVALIADRTHSGVGIGSTRAEVREALGEPEDVSAIRASIWKYGDLEVSFHEGRVFLLVLHATGATVVFDADETLDSVSIT